MELTVERPAHGGHCIARHDGRVVFVRHGLPGERVRARFTAADDGASYWRADVTEVLEPSVHRVAHPWREADALYAHHSGSQPVGGAEFGHIALAEQRVLKAAIFAEQLRRLAKIDREVVVEAAPGESADGLGWRTRVGFAVDAQGKLAMHVHRSENLVRVRMMPLAVQAVNALGLAELDLSGLSKVDVAAGVGEPLVLLTPAARTSAKRVAAIAGSITGASVSVHDPESGAVRRIKGRTWVQEENPPHSYRVTGAGFWQIHREAPAVLTAAVLAGLDVQSGESVADLYAGAGLFTAPLAAAVGAGGTVVSVEGSPGASRDARRNLHGYPHVGIVQGRVDAVLGARDTRFDAILLDPPRAGAGRKTVELISRAASRLVGYVSCDPASFARDLALFSEQGWSMESLRVFDLYPHTHHMESFAVLRRC